IRHVESSWTIGVAGRIPEQKVSDRVRCISRTVTLPVLRQPSPTASDLSHVEDLQKRLADLRAHGASSEEIREANRLARRAAMGLRIAEARSRGRDLDVEFHAMRLGVTAMVGIALEPFAEIGAQVKAR